MGRARRASVGARPGAPARVRAVSKREQRGVRQEPNYNFYFKCSNNNARPVGLVKSYYYYPVLPST